MEREWYERGYIELGIFTRAIEKLSSSIEEESEIKDFVSKNRQLGDGIGKSGIRKLRIPLRGKGKRGGGRVIYYFSDNKNAFILFMMIYSKAKKEDLSDKEEKLLEKALKSVLEELSERDNRDCN